MKSYHYPKIFYFFYKWFKRSQVTIRRLLVFILNVVNYVSLAVTTSLFLFLVLYWGKIFYLPYSVIRNFGYFILLLYGYRFLFFLVYETRDVARLIIKAILLFIVFLFSFGFLDSYFTDEFNLLLFTVVISIIFLRLWVPVIQNIYTFFHKIEHLFILSFFIIIFVGAVFIFALPGARTQPISFVDALFVSTSAVCVTGLSTVDLPSTFTYFGQVIIMILIQLGGIGIITFLSFMAYSGRSRISYYQGKITSVSLGIAKSQSRLFFNSYMIVVLVTFIFEFIGVVLLYLTFPSSFFVASEKHKLFHVVFHSVSAFCNAGFSTIPSGLQHPAFKHAHGFLLIISFLIILGGLGFFTLFQMYLRLSESIKSIFFRKKKNLYHFGSYTHLALTTRLVLEVTFILILLSLGIYLVLEWNHSLRGENWLSRFTTSLFMIVTPRTAGFSLLDLNSLHMATIVLIMLLMWIGASPVSTGGGIKTTSVAIAFKTAFAFCLNQKDVYMFNRKISPVSIRKSLVVIFFSFFLIFLSAFFISIFDGDKPFMHILFECFSAYSTVGLSLGITPELSTASKIVLIFLMFVGRIGFITFLSVFFRYRRENLYELPEEDVLI